MDTFLHKISQVEIFNRTARDIKNCINTEIIKKKKNTCKIDSQFV